MLSCLLNAEITCDATSVADDPSSYADAITTLSSTQLIIGRCPVNNQQQQQPRFLSGLTVEIISCEIKGSKGVLRQQPTGCEG
jgi:hypothetical protein